MTPAEKTPPTLAEYEAVVANYERVRMEAVGALTTAGIYMLAGPEDPTGPGEVSRAIHRLAEERDAAVKRAEEWHRSGQMAADMLNASLARERALVEACEAALAYIPGSEVRSWPPGFGLRKDAMVKIKAALAAAGKGETRG